MSKKQSFMFKKLIEDGVKISEKLSYNNLEQVKDREIVQEKFDIWRHNAFYSIDKLGEDGISIQREVANSDLSISWLRKDSVEKIIRLLKAAWNISKIANNKDVNFIKKVDVNKPEKTFSNNNKIFISYSSKDKAIAGEVKEYFGSYGFEVFLAHDDIEVSEIWKEEIEKELRAMSVFMLLLSENYNNSIWCQQETGAAYIKDVLIIPISLDNTLPRGLLDKFQACFINNNKLRIFKDVLLNILDKTQISDTVFISISSKLSEIGSFAEAAKFTPLLLDINFNKFGINEICNAINNNGQVHQSFDARPDIWRLIQKYRDLIKAKTLKAIKINTQYKHAKEYFHKYPNYKDAIRKS
jgi:hypothetical protein